MTITIKKKFPTQYLLVCNKCGREGYIHKKYYDKFGWKHECPDDIKQSEKYLDSIGVDYDYVTTINKKIIVFRNGTTSNYDTFIERHNKELQMEASDVVFTPHPEEKPVDNEVSRADTEVIMKKPKKKNK